jgi:hippurate hydrolase
MQGSTSSDPGASALGAQRDAESEALLARALALRHDLHAHPELRFEETRTAGVIRAELARLDIPWEACAGTGTLGRLAPRARGEHIAFRADIDALPVVEQTGLPYASTHPGRMHACGHDGHTASLLAAAAWLKRHEAALPGPVTLLFQPGEEGGHGAVRMIEGGALRGVDAIFGYHNWPPIPAGRAACVDGTIMGANGHFRATVHGRGGHASQPEACIDPIVALCHFVTLAQQVVSRRAAPQSAAVVTVATLQAGTASNIIPDTASATGTIRAPTTAEREGIAARCEEALRGACLATGATPAWEWSADYPATRNDPRCAARARDALVRALGPECLVTAGIPIMAAEDFSYYCEAVPGCFVLLGAGRPGEPLEPCHSARFDYSDALIPVVVNVWADLAGLAPERARLPV